MNARVILAAFVLALLIVGCSPTDYTNSDNVDIQSFVPTGLAESRVILQDTRLVRNCINGHTALIHEALEVGAAGETGVEWTVGNEQGTGFIVKASSMPAAVDLTRPLGSTILMQVKSATAMHETKDLSAEPNHRVAYNYQVSEVWQSGRVEVTFKYLRTVPIEVRYRSGLRLEITRQESRPCEDGPSDD